MQTRARSDTREALQQSMNADQGEIWHQSGVAAEYECRPERDLAPERCCSRVWMQTRVRSGTRAPDRCSTATVKVLQHSHLAPGSVYSLSVIRTPHAFRVPYQLMS
ncbi:hypothetical protein NDU88_000459 [Pleurodeles waltl]|uniref:Uncharacterized protein n=1 Tax=Pleurodeles waltl TaxID=8319 RepID=A0AAV7U5I8_PLEWA|nr:hypothetical protein NDU88_000459 [Pleurodeles waltl]